MAKINLRDWLLPRKRMEPQPIHPGLHHYMREADGLYTRFHLRVEPDGRGFLLANASAAAQLSPTGVIMAIGILESQSEKAIVADLKDRYKGAPTETIISDLNQIQTLINRALIPEDEYPVINLDDLNLSIYESQFMAPLEASLSLAAPEKMGPILDRLWQIGIPHVTIFLPEAGNSEHLVRAVERAEDLGMIAGVRGRATDLAANSLLEELAQAGVDHVTVVVAAAASELHDRFLGEGDFDHIQPVLQTIQLSEVYPLVEIPLVADTLAPLESTLTWLQKAGIHTFSFFGIVAPQDFPEEQRNGALTATAMPQTADWVEEIADEMDVRFLWQPPAQRQPELTLAQQIKNGPRSSGDTAIRVEADGELYPPRGPRRPAGNILQDNWDTIWNHQAFTHYRERVAQPTRCQECPGLVICAVDCPREPAGWSLPEGESQ